MRKTKILITVIIAIYCFPVFGQHFDGQGYWPFVEPEFLYPIKQDTVSVIDTVVVVFEDVAGFDRGFVITQKHAYNNTDTAYYIIDTLDNYITPIYVDWMSYQVTQLDNRRDRDSINVLNKRAKLNDLRKAFLSSQSTMGVTSPDTSYQTNKVEIQFRPLYVDTIEHTITNTSGDNYILTLDYKEGGYTELSTTTDTIDKNVLSQMLADHIARIERVKARDSLDWVDEQEICRLLINAYVIEIDDKGGTPPPR